MKPTRNTIEAFLKKRPVAVFGASRGGRKFGNAVYRHLKVNGGAYAVHPESEEIEGERCYPNLEGIPERVEAAVLVIPPGEAEKVVKDCLTYGIRHIWLQRGAESPEIIRYCEDHGVQPIHGECIMMYAEPVRSIHKFHHTLWKLLGRLPAPEEV